MAVVCYDKQVAPITGGKAERVGLHLHTALVDEPKDRKPDAFHFFGAVVLAMRQVVRSLFLYSLAYPISIGQRDNLLDQRIGSASQLNHDVTR